MPAELGESLKRDQISPRAVCVGVSQRISINQRYTAQPDLNTTLEEPMTVRIKRLNDAVHMEAINDDGNRLEMDGIESLGGIQGGFRPMEMLLAAIGGCAAVDVVMILSKQRQNPDGLEVVVDGERASIEGAQHTHFKTIHLHFELTGDKLDENKVKRAIELSIEKYCSVAKALQHDSEVTTGYTINQ